MANNLDVKTWIEGLRGAFYELARKLSALQTKLPQKTDPEKRLAENVNPGGATAIATLLGTLLNQGFLPATSDVMDVQTADRMIRAYLESTQWVEEIEGVAEVQPVKVARDDIRLKLNTVFDTNPDLLKDLVDESNDLVVQSPVAPDAFARHLQNALYTLQQTQDDTALIPDSISKKLATNWQSIITKMELNTPQPGSYGFLSQIADLLRIRELLEKVYDLLEQDISSDSPFDVVNI